MIRTALTLTAAGLLLAGCGGSDTADVDEPRAAARATQAPAPVATPERSARCLDVDPAKLAALAEGAESDVGGLTFTDGAAVKSSDYGEVYMIAGRFNAPGVDGEVGVWASNSLNAGEGVYMSVDGFAQQFTVWPDADTTDANITQSADGVSEARECLE